MKKLTALLLAIARMVTCTLCAVAEDGKTYMAVCIASEPDTLDPALNSAVDGATMVAHLFAGLSTWAQTDDGKLEILLNKDLTGLNSTTYTTKNGDKTYTTTINGGGLIIKEGDTDQNPISITKNNITMGGQQVHNVQAGTA